MKLRTGTFCCMTLVSLTWLVLLSIELFLRWDVSDPAQRSLTVMLVLINTITVILLPALLIVQFRAWLDVARMLLLLFGHFGPAIAFTIGNKRFTCPDDTPDDNGVCQLVNLYILLGSWVIPALLLVYSACFGIYLYRNRQSQGCPQTAKRFDIEEAVTPTVAELPIMPPPPPPPNDQRISASSASSYPSTTDRHLSVNTSRPAWLDEDPSIPKTPKTAVFVTTEYKDKDSETSSKNSRSSRSSARLSKRLPDMYF